MTVYRYRRAVGGPVPITQYVPGAVISALTNTYVDVDVATENLEDLTDYMTSCGFTFVGSSAGLSSPNMAEKFADFDWASNFDSYRVRNIALGASFNHSTPVPSDFGSLISLGIMIIPNGINAGRTATFTLTYGPLGGADNTHAHATNVGYDAVGSRLTYLDCSAAVVEPLTPGGSCGIQVLNVDGPTMSCIYSVLRYNRI